MEVILGDFMTSSRNTEARGLGELGRNGRYLRVHLCSSHSERCKGNGEKESPDDSISSGMWHSHYWRVRHETEINAGSEYRHD